MNGRTILLTIKQVFSDQILAGEKQFEYRKRPPRITEPARTIMYVSGVKEIVGEFTMRPASGERTSLGFRLPVRAPIEYPEPISWAAVRQAIPGIRPPQQSFRYLDPANEEDAQLLDMLDRHRGR